MPAVVRPCFRPVGPALCAALLAAATACSEPASPGTPDAGDRPRLREPFSVPLFDAVRIGSKPSGPNFQRAATTLEIPALPYESATLVADLDTTCFPFSKWEANPPPAGQNWPADCDAFDRNYEFILDPPSSADAPPGLELVRAITPFGGPLHLEIDVTDIANGLPGAHDLAVAISTWSDGAGQVSGSDGGWNVTARLDLVPGTPPRNVLAVVPLVNGSLGPQQSPPAIPFSLPAGTAAARIEYRVTGHGGGTDSSGACIGPAEEFCRRKHHVYLDGAEIATLEPWRTDCAAGCTLATDPRFGTYCAQNPCGDQRSVRASRANWCPGSLTPPIVLAPAALAAPGDHAFRYAIDGVRPGGMWRVSAAVFAFDG